MNEIKGDLAFDHVDFAYEPRKPVLEDVTFESRPGSVTALVGSWARENPPSSDWSPPFINRMPVAYSLTVRSQQSAAGFLPQRFGSGVAGFIPV